MVIVSYTARVSHYLPMTCLLACIASCVHIPLAPSDPPPFEWSVERQALPALTLRVGVVASVAARARHVIDEGGDELVQMPVYGLVVEHPREGLILIDAGYGRRTATDPDDYPGKQAAQMMRLQMRPDGALADQLSDIGRQPDEVRHIVVTHLHHDHIGGVEDFPQAALWVHREEWEAASRPGPLGHKTDLRPFSSVASLKTFDFERDSPYGPFPGHLDLFGDGTVILLPSPGHTPGHTSVLVNLKEQSLLLIGDAAWVDLHWQEGRPKGRAVREILEDDWRENMESLWRIKRWVDQYPELLVLSGHEVGALKWLKAWPEPYR